MPTVTGMGLLGLGYSIRTVLVLQDQGYTISTCTGPTGSTPGYSICSCTGPTGSTPGYRIRTVLVVAGLGYSISTVLVVAGLG